ncbi:hypothetical protein SNE40_021157 [Patella caerulea]|uniref:Endonuclease/reverse transcriptase n=1 Tax=Patella caerulea TaxID=87958 RepID=A0AAN8GGJ7_PATCE
MEFHPEKCTVIHVTNKKTITKYQYNLHGHTLESVTNSKYLGVTISKNLKWDDHIGNIRSKASRTLGFINRNLKGCKQPVKAIAYTTLVRPTLEYASSIWDPYQRKNIKSLESVQRRAARFATSNYSDRTPGSVTSILQDLQWESLETRRVRSRLAMFYKITHGLIDIPPLDYLTPGDGRTRGTNKYRQPPTHRDVYKYSFFPRTITDWNRLPNVITQAANINEFRAQLSKIPAALLTPNV